TFIGAEWQCAASIFAGAVGETGLGSADRPAPRMCQHQLLALEAQLIFIADSRALSGQQAFAGHAIQCSGLALGVIVLLLGSIELKLKMMIFMRGQVKGKTRFPVIGLGGFAVAKSALICKRGAINVA